MQDGRFLQGDSVTVTYSCSGADQITNDLLTAFQLNPFSLPVTITSAAVEPAPSPGEDFDVEFTWDYTLPQNIVDFAIGLGVTGFTITNGENPVSAITGATGSSAGSSSASHPVALGDGSVPVGYTEGPFTGTFNRTADVDGLIEFKPQTITNTTTASTGTALNLECTPGAGVLSVTDETGTAPSTTTTTRPGIVTTTTGAPTPTTADVGGAELPRTGTSSNLFLVLLALALIDVGYLALSASRDRRVPSAS